MSLSRSSRPKLAPCAFAADDATASNANSGASRDVVIARVRVVETTGVPRRFSSRLPAARSGSRLTNQGGVIGPAGRFSRPCHFSMAQVTALRGVTAGVGAASPAPRVGGRARAFAVASRGSVGAPRVSLSPSSRGCDFAGSARDLAASTSRGRAQGTRVRAVQTRAVQGTSFPPPPSIRGNPSRGSLPNLSPISASPASHHPNSFLPLPRR
jgi:hypothetical protein